MDFIKKLPLFSKFNTILVIVNKLTKQEIFIFTYNTITSIYPLYILQTWCFFLYYFW